MGFTTDDLYKSYVATSAKLKDCVPQEVRIRGINLVNRASQYFYMPGDFETIVEYHRNMVQKYPQAWPLLLKVLDSAIRLLQRYGITAEELKLCLQYAVEYNHVFASNAQGQALFRSPILQQGVKRVQAIREKMGKKEKALKYM